MIKFAFFGSSDFSIYVLDALKAKGFVPAVVITTPDKPKGRGLALTPTSVKLWAQKNAIPVIDPIRFDDAFLGQLKKYAVESLSLDHWPLFVVASYGKIIPETIISLPVRKTLNIHPSLLPKYRGAAPVQAAMLDDAKDTGVTIIRLDKEIDHGPIIAAEKVHFDEWPIYEKVEEKLGIVGGDLLAKIVSDWMQGKIKEEEQDHSQATFTKKLVKEDGLLECADISSEAPTERAYLAFRKIQAYHAWPGAYFFVEKNGKKIRIKTTSASWKDTQLVIENVVPEGKKEVSYKDFLNG